VAGPIVDENRIAVDVEAHGSPRFLIGRGTEGSGFVESAVEGPIEVRWRTRPRARIPERHKRNDDQYEKGISYREGALASSTESAGARSRNLDPIYGSVKRIKEETLGLGFEPLEELGGVSRSLRHVQGRVESVIGPVIGLNPYQERYGCSRGHRGKRVHNHPRQQTEERRGN
jgi:hypothetical protein